MASYLRTLRGFNRDTRLVLALQAAIGFVYFGLQAVLYNLYLLRLGFGPDFIGLLGGMGQLTWALFALPAGAIGARLGLRQAIQAGMAISVITNGLFLLSESLPAEWRVPWMVLFSLMGWVGSALFTVNNVPYLKAITRPEERNHAFAVQSGLFSLLGFAGSLLAGKLPGWFGAWQGLSLEAAGPYRMALWLAPPVLFLGFLAISLARPARLSGEVQAAQGKEPPRRKAFSPSFSWPGLPDCSFACLPSLRPGWAPRPAANRRMDRQTLCSISPGSARNPAREPSPPARPQPLSPREPRRPAICQTWRSRILAGG